MDNLVYEMTGESIEHVGQLVVAKLNEKGPTELRAAVNIIFDALYAPLIPKDEKFERFITFLRDMFDEFDDQTRQAVTLRIRNMCIAAKHEQSGKIIENVVPKVTDEAKPRAFAANPALPRKLKAVGKAVKIKVGIRYGSIGHVQRVTNDKVIVKFANGLIVPYLRKCVEFLE